MANYKTLIDYPSIPAGEILAPSMNGTIYVGQTHSEFWMDKHVVENTPASFEIVP